MNRVLAAARMHLAHPVVILGIPWMVVGTSFAITLAIWALGDVGENPGSEDTAGGLASFYVTVLVVFVQAVTQMFPFAMGVSLSRRVFYAGTALVAAAQAVGYGLVLSVFAAVEHATDGWGVGLHFWAPGWLDVQNPALQALVYALPMLACAFLGMAIGVVHKRWGASGLWALLIATMLVLGGAAVLLTGLAAWSDLGRWLTEQSIYDYTLLLPAVAAVILAGLTWTGLRRTVP